MLFGRISDMLLHHSSVIYLYKKKIIITCSTDLVITTKKTIINLLCCSHLSPNCFALKCRSTSMSTYTPAIYIYIYIYIYIHIHFIFLAFDLTIISRIVHLHGLVCLPARCRDQFIYWVSRVPSINNQKKYEALMESNSCRCRIMTRWPEFNSCIACISHSTNTLGQCMNPTMLPLDMYK